MRTRYEAWMNGAALSEIDGDIMVTDIREKAPTMKPVTIAKGWADGTRLAGNFRQSLSVAIRFCIRAYATEKRKDACSRVREWAREGWLEISDRPEQRLYVVCSTPPNIDSALRWTDTVEMVLTAYEVPWWEATAPNKATYSGKNGNTTLSVVGQAEAPLDMSVTATSTITRVKVSANGKTITVDGLNVEAGKRLEMSHQKNGLLSIKADGVSVLGKRTAMSADDLMVKPGANTIAFEANTECTAVFTARGRFE